MATGQEEQAGLEQGREEEGHSTLKGQWAFFFQRCCNHSFRHTKLIGSLANKLLKFQYNCNKTIQL